VVSFAPAYKILKMFHVKHFGQNIPALFHVKQKRHEEKCFT
jgi:hypothetical protein